MDFSKLPNPYDFANPINDPDLFIGRTTEMGDIKYYLDHASRALRPINLAIIGERASGKTSTLNMIQLEAVNRGFCAVRVDLDEADAKTQLAFFYKIFDSILTTVCSLGVYGGLTGKTYDTYRDMVDAYEIPEDKTFCSFLFPIQYAKAMNRGNDSASLSDTAFRQDIIHIQKELGRPIALVFDECDVLGKSRVHLEKLRNIFMNTSGFMLVFTGTPSLFPLMDDVFSPIIRQFKKINIIPFKVQNETRDCIRKPLEKIGIKHPSEIFDFETYRDVSEIHDLTGGRPYEIQLICHFLFRRIQENRAKSMELTLDVLDDVRKELETSQDVSARPILNLIRNFDKRELSALGLLCICNGHANFEQIWFSEYVFRGDSEWRKNLLWEQLCKLEEMRVITVKDGVIKFSGDDFDKIYCKYFARTYRVSLPMDDFPYEVCLIMNLTSLLEGKLKGIDPFPIFFAGDTESTNFQNVITALLSDDESSDPFEATPGIAEVTYWSCLRFRDNNSFKIATVTVISPWIKVQQWYGYKNPKQDVESALDNLSSILADISERAIAIGGALKVDIHTLPVVPVQSLIRKVERSGNARMRHSLLAQHYNKMIDAYTEQHDIKEAFFHGSLAYHYNLISNDINPWIANNLGYIFLVSDDLLKARQMLKMAANDHIKPEDSALSNYNLGILEAKEGNLEDALISIKLAIERIKTTEEENRQCSYLLSPKIVEAGDMLVFQELSQPDLLATAESAVSTIEELLQKSQSRIGTLVGV